MARFYSNENFPLRVVSELRKLGHDVLTSLDAGQANRRLPDEEVLRFAASQARALLTLNRRDFVSLHRQSGIRHSGIIICTVDLDFEGQAKRISSGVGAAASLENQLIRINRPAIP